MCIFFLSIILTIQMLFKFEYMLQNYCTTKESYFHLVLHFWQNIISVSVIRFSTWLQFKLQHLRKKTFTRCTMLLLSVIHVNVIKMGIIEIKISNFFQQKVKSLYLSLYTPNRNHRIIQKIKSNFGEDFKRRFVGKL